MLLANSGNAVSPSQHPRSSVCRALSCPAPTGSAVSSLQLLRFSANSLLSYRTQIHSALHQLRSGVYQVFS